MLSLGLHECNVVKLCMLTTSIERPQPSRSQRSAQAVKEVSDLAFDLTPTPARGVDARSMAAKPPGGFTITKVFEDFKPRGGGGYRPQNNGTFRKTGRPGARGGARAGPPRPGGRGGGGPGRGRKRGGKRAKLPKQKENLEEWVHPLLTKEEAKYRDGSEQGFLTPYEPTASAESLARHGPPVISSPKGTVESIVWKMRVATGINTAGYDDAERHLMRVQRGTGTLFENEEQRAVIQAFNQQEGKERAEDMGVPYEPELSEFGSLSEKDQARMLKEWVGGQYVFPKPAEVGDVLGQVAGYARRNETYLPDDTRKLQEKLKSLLPASTTQNRTATKPRTGSTRNLL
jgi:hypothetical protein